MGQIALATLSPGRFVWNQSQEQYLEAARQCGLNFLLILTDGGRTVSYLWNKRMQELWVTVGNPKERPESRSS